MHNFLSGGGEMGHLIRTFEWEKTPLGSPDKWPNSLKTIVRIMLTSQQPIWIGWGKEAIKLYNDPYRSIVGGKHPWALGKPASEVWKDIWDEAGPRLIKAMNQNEGTYDESLLLIMERNGYSEETYYTFSYSPVPDDDGTIGGIFCANTEDTQRIIGERQLKLLQDLGSINRTHSRSLDEVYQTCVNCLQQNIHDLPFSMIYILDEDGGNFELKGSTGLYKDHEVLKERIEFEDTSLWPCGTALSTNVPFIIQDLAKRDNDLPKGAWDRPPHQAVIMPIQSNATAGKSGVLIVGLNPYRLFDEEYSGFVSLIAGQIASRIAEIQTYEAEKKRVEALEELDKAKTLFFSNVSHEFRTPLTLMLGPLQDILHNSSGDLVAVRREQVELIQRNGIRLQKLVNALLDFSRIEAGRTQAKFEPVDLASYTRELASVFQSAFDKAGLDFIIDTGSFSETVYIDKDMWEKILLNLLSNAFKFTQDGSVKVLLDMDERDMKLVVSDTGIGINKDDLNNIFKRFHRIEGVKSRTHEGSGIGLSLVQELVKLHHGAITVESEPEIGTRFTVSVPRGRQHLSDEMIVKSGDIRQTMNIRSFVEEALRSLPDFAEKQECAEEIQTEKQKPLIILADDNLDMRKYVSGLLKDKYRVVTAENGKEVLEMLKDLKPELILSDVMMPVLDGFGLLKEIKRNPELRNTPVLLLSARAGEEAQEEGLRKGADDYLVKPFSARELLTRVDARIEISRTRREAEIELQEQRNKLSNIFTNAPAAIALVEGDNHIFTLANPWYRQMFSRTEEQLIGKPMREVFQEMGQHEVFDIFDEILKSGEAHVSDEMPVEFYRHNSDVKEIGYFNFVAQPLTDNSGNISSLLILAYEVTEEVKLRNKIKESEVYFRHMTDNVPIIIWVTEKDGYCSYLNKQWYDYTGQQRDEELGWEWLKAVHPEDSDKAREVFKNANERCKPFNITYRLKKANGLYEWHIDSGVPRFDENNQLLGYIGTVVNIHDLKLAQEALKANEERLTIAVSAASLGTWDFNPQTGLLEWDGRCKELFGLPSDAFVDYDIFLKGLHPDDREKTEAAVKSALSPEGDGRFDIEYRTVGVLDGKERWVRAAGKAFFNNYAADRFIGTILDITDQKRFEQTLKSKNEELQKINSDLDNFVYTASHDLKAPIINIEGLIKALSSEYFVENDETKELFDMVHQSIESFKTTIHDLADVAKVQAWSLAEEEIIQFREAAEHAKLHIKDLISSFDAEILEDYSKATEISFSGKNLRSIFYNLLSNGIKYSSPERKPRIKVTTQDSGEFILLSFEDNGLGIPKEDHLKVFSMFKRLHDHVEGSGVGMAIVKKIIDNNEGKIEIESEVGRGTVFKIFLRK